MSKPKKLTREEEKNIRTGGEKEGSCYQKAFAAAMLYAENKRISHAENDSGIFVDVRHPRQAVCQIKYYECEVYDCLCADK